MRQRSRPLTSKTLIWVLLCSLVTVLISTPILFHIVRHLHKKNAVENLISYSTQKFLRDRVLFDEAVTNHAVMKSALLRLVIQWEHAPPHERDPQVAFNRRYKTFVDGSIRSRAASFDPTRNAGLFAKSHTQLSALDRYLLVHASELLQHLGQAWLSKFPDTYFASPKNYISIFWPAAPTYIYDAEPDYTLVKDEWFYISDKAHNPDRKTAWTEFFYDQVSKLFMVSVETPVDHPQTGEHLLTIGHDVMLDQFMQQIEVKGLPYTKNMVFSKTGKLIAHPDYRERLKSNAGDLAILDTGDKELMGIFQQIANKPDIHDGVFEIPQVGQTIWVNKIQNTDWYYVIAMSHLAYEDAIESTKWLVLCLLLILCAVQAGAIYGMMRLKVIDRIERLIRATQNYRVGKTLTFEQEESADEITELSHSFQTMIQQVNERDQRLRENALNLEQKVAERTRELKARTEELEATNKIILDQQQTLAHASKMSALGEMAGGIAHEINNPMGVIHLRAQQIGRMARKVKDVDPRIPEFAEAIIATTRVVDKIIRGLRNFSRQTDADDMEYTCFADLIQETLLLCQEKLKHRQVTLDIQNMTDIPHFYARKTQISQILMNLLSNSLDALDPLEEKWIKITAHADDRYVYLSVTDSGTIDRTVIDRIFQPLFTTKEIGKGTGLGLSISQGIAKVHGGNLRLDLSVTHTCFELSLPRPPQSPSKTPVQ